MTSTAVAAVLLIALPIAFNAAFFGLARAFDYPDILRRPTDEILRRFDAGGAALRTLWWGFMLAALAMLPLSILVGIEIARTTPALALASIVVGAVASLVQTLGLARWPFVVPELARRWIAAGDDADGAEARRSIEVVFVALHRYLGVGVGEHLGYLLTGAWTVLVGLAVTGIGGTAMTALGLLGLPIGLALMVGALEFVGANEPQGWPLAGRIVPVAYIGWSLWLIALGVGLLLG